MIWVNNVTLRFSDKVLFENVNIKFTKGNCYGIIGANGAGKTTFLKILSGEIEPTEGEVVISKNERISVLRQDHYAFDSYKVLDTVIMGNKALYDVMCKRNEIYSKPDFTEEDGIKASKLEEKFADMDGYDAEAKAASLLEGLGIKVEYHQKYMKDIPAVNKVKVLLAQALFGNPDILLLDEPTNHLDIQTVNWLEEFLINYQNIVIVVSHDRYFLNKVCTYTADVDFGKITLYTGNYDFWYQSSQLALKQAKQSNKKKEEKIKELKEFIQRFSANASKSKQATSRKKSLEKIDLEEIKPSNRKYPYIDFKTQRSIGSEVLKVMGVSKTIDGKKVLDNVTFDVLNTDKIVFLGTDGRAQTTLFKILTGEIEPDRGRISWGVTTTQSYFPKDSTKYFEKDINLTDWLMQYSKEKNPTYIRGFLGRMLFSGSDSVKDVKVLSGGEKVRCMLAKMMCEFANVLILDEPTNHLDMEAITALNDGLISFKGVVLFVSHDHQFVQTVANRVIDIKPDGSIVDKRLTYDEYLNLN